MRRTSSVRAPFPGVNRTSPRCAPSTSRPLQVIGEPHAGAKPGGGGQRGNPRRHLPYRRRGPLGKHGLGHAVRRLAAVVAGDSGARVLPGHPAADDVAGARNAVHADAGQAAADHADADAGAARRQLLSPRSARRAETSRTSGSCCTCCGPSSAGTRRSRPSMRRRSTRRRCPGRSGRAPGSRAAPSSRIGWATDVIAGLERRGHRITRAGDWTLGRLSAVVRDPGTGVLQAAANPRGAQGYAAGR